MTGTTCRLCRTTDPGGINAAVGIWPLAVTVHVAGVPRVGGILNDGSGIALPGRLCPGRVTGISAKGHCAGSCSELRPVGVIDIEAHQNLCACLVSCGLIAHMTNIAGHELGIHMDCMGAGLGCRTAKGKGSGSSKTGICPDGGINRWKSVTGITGSFESATVRMALHTVLIVAGMGGMGLINYFGGAVLMVLCFMMTDLTDVGRSS